MNGFGKWSIGCGVSLLLAACALPPEQATGAATASVAGDFQLAIGHINDHHSNLDPNPRTSIQYQDESLRVESGGFARVAALYEQLEQKHPHLLKLHAGDAITGSLYYTLFAGEADAKLMNHICFDGFALGNHEFDQGDAGLKTFLRFLQQGYCKTPVLAANVKPEVGRSPLTPTSEWDSFKPYQIYQIGSQRVGVIGLDIAKKTKQSSQPDASTLFLDEEATARKYIAELRQQGVGKIVLLTHYQYKNDLALAQRLPEVDVIIGGDSHTLLGDFAAYGLPTQGDYPTVMTNADGDQVCVAHAYQYAQVVGELLVDFVGDRVASCGGRPHFLLAESAPAVLDQSGVFTRIAPQPEAIKIRETYANDVAVLTQQKIAVAAELICMRRYGTFTREACGRGRQSDMHHLVARAFLHSVRDADFALQNGGGVRADIPAGPISLGDAYRILPFANTLVKVQITGAELKQLLEQTVAYTLLDSGSDGAYPHGADIRFDVDMTANEGQRVGNIRVRDRAQESGLAWRPVTADEYYTMVTNSFVAGGSDGWKLLAELSAEGRVEDTYIEYAESFANWLKATKTIQRPQMHSTDQYISR